MGCNTSQEAAQKVEEEKKESRQELKKLEENCIKDENDLQDITEELQSDDLLQFTGSEEEQQAATKIQAVFRGHKARRETKEPEQPPQTTTGEQRAAPDMSGNKAEPEPSKAELEAEFSPEDKELCHAATKIQASFRGHQVRKQAEQATAKDLEDLAAKAEELDIDLTDPELNKAATKIQASFRGHKVRKDTDN